MSTHLNLTRIADDIIELRVNSISEAQALASSLRMQPFLEDIVAGYESVCVRFDPAHQEAVEAYLCNIARPEISASDTKPAMHIPVQYGGEFGPDLEHVCTQLEISKGDFITLHTSAFHTVDMLGFTPGFAYVSGLPNTVGVPRLSTPRPRIAAGSIGISGSQTGLYAMAGPGGWPLIGRTGITLFDSGATSPFILSPDQRIKFEAV